MAYAFLPHLKFVREGMEPFKAAPANIGPRRLSVLTSTRKSAALLFLGGPGKRLSALRSGHYPGKVKML